MLCFPNPPRDGEGDRARSAWGRGPRAPRRDRRAPSTSLRLVPLPVPGRIKREGFTLVELMVVLVIIGLLATIVIINVMPAADRAATTKARADIATLEQAVDLYKISNPAYPTTEQGLNVLVPDFIRRLPNDPWNRPYTYSSPGRDGRPYTIATLGADGREGGSEENADISN